MVLVPMYDWQAFLIPFSKAVKGIKQYHHFSFTHQAQGVAMATTHSEGPTQILPVLVGDAGAFPHAPPPRVQSPGLSAYRQWYLFNSIRDFCTDDTKDIMCPKPTVPQPGPDKLQHHFLRMRQTLKVVVMPLPEVVVGAGVVVVVGVVVRAEEVGEAVGEGELHKGYQTQNHHLHWRRRWRKRGEKWTLHHQPGPGPCPDNQPDHQGHRRAVGGVAAVGVGAEVVAVQGDVRPPDRLSYCDYY